MENKSKNLHKLVKRSNQDLMTLNNYTERNSTNSCNSWAVTVYFLKVRIYVLFLLIEKLTKHLDIISINITLVMCH